MDKKMDFRVQRTYISLQNALLQLLQEKNFDNITVGELCEKAMIRRATFYKHFGDKYELFAFCIRELQEKFKEQNGLIYDQSRPQTFYVSMIDYFLQFVEEHCDILKSLMTGGSSQMLFDIISREIESDIRSHLRQDEKNGAMLPSRPEILATMITGSLVYTMKWWVTHDLAIPREELVQVSISLIRII